VELRSLGGITSNLPVIRPESIPSSEITSYKRNFPVLIRTMPNWITSESPTRPLGKITVLPVVCPTPST
jgi:hypothetical protein